jgi:hypothetical protein
MTIDLDALEKSTRDALDHSLANPEVDSHASIHLAILNELIQCLREAELDAARYRWLREQQWNSSNLFVIAGSKSRIRLGTDCPSLVLLDNAIDAAIDQQRKIATGEDLHL